MTWLLEIIMKISIAIPTWEYNGRGTEFLEDLLRTIEIQTFKNFEVCISDHSQDNKIYDLISKFSDKFEIKYLKNSNDRGNGPSNTNKALEMCSGDLIKLMFQDDFFYDDEALEKIHNEFLEDVNWLVCGSNHTKDDGVSFYWDFYPRWNDKIIEGVNTISSPSVLCARRKIFEEIKFDSNLVMLMDCEFYFSVKEKFGYPLYYHDVLVTNRVHIDQISNKLKNKTLDEEIFYCKKKHGIMK